MFQYFFILLILLGYSSTGFSQPLLLDEVLLYKQFETLSPGARYLDNQSLSSELGRSLKDDAYTPSLYSKGSYQESEGKQLSSFIPVTSPSKNIELGLKKKSVYGLNYSVAGFSEQYSNNFLNKATTSGLKAAITIDLFKDFLGRSGKNELRGLEEESKWKKLEASVGKSALFNEIRKLYFSLVANNESQALVAGLIVTSEKQVKSSQERFRNKVADIGEVAKYQSQLASRKAQNLSLLHRQEVMMRTLKELLPDLKNHELQLKPVNEEVISQKILGCAQRVFSFKQAPLEFSNYDEIANLVISSGEFKETVAKNLDAIDLKLMSEYKSSGKALGYSESLDDFSDDKRSSYQVGFMLDIPLNFNSTKSSDVKTILEKKFKEAKSTENISKVESLHEQTLKSINYLNEVIKEQAANTKYLNQPLQETQKKFRQARVSVEQLVYEQDLYQQSKLMEIDTKLILVQTLLDYLSVYHDFPCDFNKVI